MRCRGGKESLLMTFISTMQGPCAVKKGESVLVCVSGGIDSMVLLHLMMESRQYLDMRCGVIHVEHGLRGAESAYHADFVSDFCLLHDLSFHLARLGMDPKTPNLEERARTRRYEAILECMHAHGYAAAATGHTQDDQAETILYRMIRGSGIRGLSGMDFRRPDGIIRPLLDTPKGLVRDYALEIGIAYVNDSSNMDTRLARNLIRTAIIPEMERINPQAVRSIASLAYIARREGAALEEMAHDLEKRASVHDWGLVRTFRSGDLTAESEAVRRRFFIRVISGFLNEPRGFDADQVVACLAVLEGRMRSHTMHRKVRILKDKDLLVIHAVQHGPCYDRDIAKAAEVFIPEIKRHVRISMPHPVPAGVRLRSYMKGDRIQGEKVAGILSGLKVPVPLRAFWPVLVSDQEVLAVASYQRGSSPYALTWVDIHG